MQELGDSEDAVMSQKAVTENIKKVDSNIKSLYGYSTHDFSITDKENKAIVVFDKGHIRTKNFDSEKLVKDSPHDFSITDKDNKAIVVFDKGHIRTKNFDSEKLQISNNMEELSVVWNKSYYINTDGSLLVSSELPTTMTTDYINYNENITVIAGFVRNAQKSILSALYDKEHVCIGFIYPLKDVIDDAESMDNREVWMTLKDGNVVLNEGKANSDIVYCRIQGNSDFDTKVYAYTNVLTDPYKNKDAYTKRTKKSHGLYFFSNKK